MLEELEINKVEKDIQIVEGLCGICPGNCAVEITLKEGRIEGIRPSKKCQHASVCLRGSKAAAVVYSENRLTSPLIRTGPKGTYEFREASWDEALKYAAEGFKAVADKYGARSLASHYGRGAFDQPYKDFADGLRDNEFPGIFGNIGSPNAGAVGSLCYQAYGLFAPVPTMGIASADILPDIGNSNVIFVWGSNPPTASPPTLYSRIKEARKRGARVITVDHYESIMAKNSDEAIIVKSGTDGALILGLINHLFKEGSYDKDFVDKYCYGFEELRDYVADFAIDRVIDICGISKEDFLTISQALGEEAVSLVTYTGLEYTNCGVQTIRAIYILWAIAGHLDEKGGLLLNKPKKFQYKLKTETKDPQTQSVGYEDFQMFCDMTGNMQFTKFPEAVLESKPYKVAGLFNVGSVISLIYPESPVIEEALMELDFFVTADRFMTKDALYADVILPATTHFEDKSYAVYPDMARIRYQVIEPIGQARSNMAIVAGLADKMGFGDAYPQSADQMIEARFADQPGLLEELKSNSQGVILKDPGIREYRKYETGGLREDGLPGFPTETGKLEFKSKMLESYGYEGLPKFEFAQEGHVNTPDLAEDYPLILNTGARIQSTFRTQHLNIDSLVKFQKDPHIIMNREDAEVRGIQSGDQVIVSSPRGEITVVADVVDGINSGDTELNMGGGQAMQHGLWAQAGVNELTDKDNYDPISGFPVFKDLLCQVRKA